MSRASKYSPEFREEAVRIAIESQRPIAHIAKELGVNSETLHTWVKRHKKNHPPEEPGLDLSERARLRELERINREQTKEIEFLKKQPRTSRRIARKRQVRVHRDHAFR